MMGGMRGSAAHLGPSTAAPSQPRDLFKHLQLDQQNIIPIFLVEISRQKQLKWLCPDWSGWCWWATNINFKCTDVVPWLIFSYVWLVNYFSCQAGQNLVLSHPKGGNANHGLSYISGSLSNSLNLLFPQYKMEWKPLEDLLFFFFFFKYVFP